MGSSFILSRQVEFECLAESSPRSGASDLHCFTEGACGIGRRSVWTAAICPSFPAGLPEKARNSLTASIPTVSESVILQWKIRLQFLVEKGISSAVSNHTAMACLSILHAQTVLHHSHSISFCLCTTGKELWVFIHQPSLLKNLQWYLYFSFCVNGDTLSTGMAGVFHLLLSRNLLETW